ncbi:competence/damage-inducible protein A [Flagellimonas allohymeniacidonis]|uniref:CinA-like protein n=1 Tax=Flagellimonas allohymeniacidonis TaxID=2517819 RepID=A0A4Q8QEB5_9FLAO|nr:competence/damage-inducible protein A [Allomuricauda hymeniacidonis]TAI46629.1 competence/damage-inducible protein A [Allomuricauda hymeniacidonis]
MQAEIITIGDEILIGQIIDSNSAFISKELNKIGVSVYQITSVQDDRQHILDALEKATHRSSLVLITGGLGPTKDDVTKHTLCEFLEDELVQNQAVLEHIEELFKKYIATPISDLNRKQALVPSKAQVLHNAYGTAPGLWMQKGVTSFVSLPGVPFEMKNLVVDQVLPKVVMEFERPHIIHRTILTHGLGESAIANIIEEWENSLPDFIKLAYLPNLGRVRLRLSAKGTDEKVLKAALDGNIKKLYPLIGDIIYGEESEGPIEQQIGRILTDKGLTLATAESFTGGKISQYITKVPGASAYFKGGVVSYATETKIQVLGVPKELVETHSVVSKEVAVAMAQNAKNILDSDFAIATTGNAGPSKGDSDADIGTVFIAISTPEDTFAEKFVMGNHRERIVQKSVNKAFELLLREILKF